MGVFLTAFIGITPLGGLGVGWLATRMDEGTVVWVATAVVVMASALFHGVHASRSQCVGEAVRTTDSGSSVVPGWLHDRVARIAESTAVAEAAGRLRPGRRQLQCLESE